LIIVPPFARLDRPVLGVHLLQAVARQSGKDVRILYANLALAGVIGVERYNAFCYGPIDALLGERYFARAAHGLSPIRQCRSGVDRAPARGARRDGEFSDEEFSELQESACAWCDHIVRQIARLRIPVVGSTTTFGQTNPSVAILKRLKASSPETRTIIGGANCEEEMADGIASLSNAIDHVFSGESEDTFVDFLSRLDGGGDIPRIIVGAPYPALDQLPAPDFNDYYAQFRALLPPRQSIDLSDVWLPYETSRGCWWGQKHHCTFCGMNGGQLSFRAKRPDRVIQDLRQIRDNHPSNQIVMADNIMPINYFADLLPRLRDELPGLHIFYEQKANLSLQKVLALSQAGVTAIQPGIESFSTDLLRHMKKGVSAAQNVALLRYARTVGLAAKWYLLYGFPGDKAVWYEQIVALLPLVRHLPPPTGVFPITIDRFSPYHYRASELGLRNLRPIDAYFDVFPESADIDAIAYQFKAEYESGSLSSSTLGDALAKGVGAWKKAWEDDTQPQLLVWKLAPDAFILYDTRAIPGNDVIEFIDADKAAVALVGAAKGAAGESVEWGLKRGACVRLEDRIVPLATSSIETLGAFEAGATG
jgi:ribosomal peptide maturation radical SAM protein 1